MSKNNCSIVSKIGRNIYFIQIAMGYCSIGILLFKIEMDLYEENNILEEYNLYEVKKTFLDNKSWKGNDLAWIMDDKSVYLSKHGDGGPYFTNEIDLPKEAKTGEVYEKIDGKLIYNATITEELNKIEKFNKELEYEEEMEMQIWVVLMK